MERTKRRVWTATKPRRQHGQDRSEDRGGPSNGKNYGKTGAKMVVLQIRLWENRIICSYKRGWRTMLKHVVLDHVEACCSVSPPFYRCPFPQAWCFSSSSGSTDLYRHIYIYVDISLHRHIYIYIPFSPSLSLSLYRSFILDLYISPYTCLSLSITIYAFKSHVYLDRYKAFWGMFRLVFCKESTLKSFHSSSNRKFCVWQSSAVSRRFSARVS